MNIRNRIPSQLKYPAKWLRNKLYYRGNKRCCPVCSREVSHFITSREGHDTKCPWCDSMARHRFVWLYLDRSLRLWDFPASTKILHVAPESAFIGKFRNHFGTNYVTSDLLSPDVDINCDITRMPFGDGEFDLIYCSHVLEHVPDDRAALAEFRRTLSPQGRAIILVPIDETREATYEDPSIVSREDRLKEFGQEDHVRVYGRDFLDRLSDAGLDCRELRWNSLFTPELMGKAEILPGAGSIFECSRK